MKTNVSVIMPQLLGDCIIAIPLLNQLTIQYNVSIVCNDYTFNTLSHIFDNAKNFSFTSKIPNQNVIIDLLGDDKSVNFIERFDAKITIGFPDAGYNYTFMLPLPYVHGDNQATEIYLASLSFLEVPKPAFLNFSISKKWLFKHQNLILIAPGAGNLDRCFSIRSFVDLANQLSLSFNVSFILGPSEHHLAKFINNQYEVIYTNHIETTLQSISKARMIISSEGGFMHLAAAYGIPMIGLFKIASPKNWFPYSNPLQVAIGNGGNNYNNLKLKVVFPLEEIISKTRRIYETVGN